MAVGTVGRPPAAASTVLAAPHGCLLAPHGVAPAYARLTSGRPRALFGGMIRQDAGPGTPDGLKAPHEL